MVFHLLRLFFVYLEAFKSADKANLKKEKQKPAGVFRNILRFTGLT